MVVSAPNRKAVTRKQRRILVVVLVAAVGAGAWWWRQSRPAGQHLVSGALRGSNLLLVTIDTLRADRVGAYGGGTLTPTLDALASRGVRFARAYAQAPMTLPAHASILTGLVPPAHGVRNNGTFRLGPPHQTLADLLRQAGYRTGAFVGAFVLDARFGLNSGFDVYDDRCGTETGPLTFGFAERPADRVLEAAGRWILDSPAPRPWFAWVHLFDPHAPYRAPEMLAADPYDSEVAFTDKQLGRFVERLRGAGHLDRTLVVALADHGESLGEHGEATHGLFAYDATLHVPFVMAGPGISQQVITARVSEVDVLPTVLDLLGIPEPPALQGRSLLGVMNGEKPVARPIYFEAVDANLTRNWAPLTGLVMDEWKYIDLPIPELYDLDRDSGELRNLVSQESARVAVFQQQLADLRAQFEGAGAAAARIDPEAAARLRSLGYTAVQVPAALRRRQFTEADDPKTLVDIDHAYEQALTLTGEGDGRRAIELLRGVIRRRPDFTAAYTTGASILIRDGRAAEATRLLEDAGARDLVTPELQTRLASAHLAAGQPERAVAVLESVVRSGEGGADAVNTLGVAYWQLRRPDEARRLFQQVLEVAPGAAGTWNNLGLVELSARHVKEAAAAFQRAVDIDPGYGAAWQGLGAARVGDDRRGAIAAWRRAVEVLPDDYDILFNLAVLLAESERPRDALPYLQRFERQAPPARYRADIERVRRLIADIDRS
jgi:arylsulfatase A-like enzyme/Tfp pilus assembly protein PilF